jgi:hypothetical protein
VGEGEPERYRFGPLERRGLVAGWRGGQIAAVASGLVVGVAVLRASSSPGAVVVALAALVAGVVVATWPVGGRTAEEWAPDAARHLLGIAARRRRHGPSPFAGLRLVSVGLDASTAATRGVDEPARRPAWTEPAAGVAGVLHDRARRTYTAVLGASAAGFVLLGEDDKARRVGDWSGVLTSLARDGSAVHRVQWVERVRPAAVSVAVPPPAGDAIHAGARASYEALLIAEARCAPHHEVFLAVTVHAGRARRAVKAAGGGDGGACAVLLREVAALRRRLADASVDVGGVLAPGELAGMVRRACDPGAPGQRDPGAPGLSAADAGAASGAALTSSVHRGWPWPMGVVTEWARLRADGAWHATFWVSEWPRVDVGPDFLGPMILSSDVVRSFSVVMEPLGPIEASRKVEQARTADIADAELRRRGGFLGTARRRREEEILARRELELADGHGQYRFTAYVTVSADDPDALEEACSRVEQAAGRAGLELRRCYGDQLNAFLCTLPLGRGLS